MGEPARQARPAGPTATRKTDDTAPIAGVLASELDQQIGSLLHGPDGHREVPPAEHREGVTQQIQGAPAAMLAWIKSGTDEGLDEIAKSEPPPPRSGLDELLSLAVSGLVAGAAGSFAAWLSGKLIARTAGKVREKFFEDAVKDVVKKACHFDPGKASPSLDDLRGAFRREVRRQHAMLVARLDIEWSKMHDHLSTLPDDELTRLVGQLQEVLKQDPGPLLAQIAAQTVVAWTNFLARARHGAMRPWDHWETNGSAGAVKLHDTPVAAAPTTGANVDPSGVDDQLALYQGVGREDDAGLLEVSIDTNGRLIQQRGYGMRLEQVGPEVRARIRTLGQVRDVHLNKIIRVCSRRDNPPMPIASLLITADGYIRRQNLSGLPPAGAGYPGAAAQVVEYAEWGQRQSLSNLED